MNNIKSEKKGLNIITVVDKVNISKSGAHPAFSLFLLIVTVANTSHILNGRKMLSNHLVIFQLFLFRLAIFNQFS